MEKSLVNPYWLVLRVFVRWSGGPSVHGSVGHAQVLSKSQVTVNLPKSRLSPFWGSFLNLNDVVLSILLGYRFPSDEFEAGYRNFVDLTIYHPKYNGKYDDHVPIDLSYLYCTMSQPHFPHAKTVWRYIANQPNANKIGPLGKRAGQMSNIVLVAISKKWISSFH